MIQWNVILLQRCTGGPREVVSFTPLKTMGTTIYNHTDEHR